MSHYLTSANDPLGLIDGSTVFPHDVKIKFVNTFYHKLIFFL